MSDTDDIMEAIPDKVDLMIVLDGVKSDEKQWRDYFAKRLLKSTNKNIDDTRLRNFTELKFFIDEITGENVKKYNCTWRKVMTALKNPTEITIENKYGEPENVSDKLRKFLSKREVKNKYKKQLSSISPPSDITNEYFPKAHVPVNQQLQKKNTADGDERNSQKTPDHTDLKQSNKTPEDASKVCCQNFRNWISKCNCLYVFIGIACIISLFLYWLISGDTEYVACLLAAIPAAVLSLVFKTVDISFDLKPPDNCTATK